MEVTEIREPSAIAELQAEWSDLVDQCPTATIFQTWEWNEAWWQAFGADKELRLLAMRDAGTLVGLAPLCIERYFGLKRLVFLGTPSSDYMDILATERATGDACAATLEYLQGARGFHWAALQCLRPGSVVSREIVSEPPCRESQTTMSWADQEPCPFAQLPATWDEYIKQLGGETRRNTAKYERRLLRTFKSVESETAQGNQAHTAADVLLNLHFRRSDQRGWRTLLADKRMHEFIHRVVESFSERGWLRLHVLCLDNTPGAASLCFLFRERYWAYNSGFAPEYTGLSLGTMMLMTTIRSAIAECCTEFDFLRGGEAYKSHWASGVRMNRQMVTRPRGFLAPTVLRGLEWARRARACVRRARSKRES